LSRGMHGELDASRAVLLQVSVKLIDYFKLPSLPQFLTCKRATPDGSIKFAAGIH